MVEAEGVEEEEAEVQCRNLLILDDPITRIQDKGVVHRGGAMEIMADSQSKPLTKLQTKSIRDKDHVPTPIKATTTKKLSRGLTLIYFVLNVMASHYHEYYSQETNRHSLAVTANKSR